MKLPIVGAVLACLVFSGCGSESDAPEASKPSAALKIQGGVVPIDTSTITIAGYRDNFTITKAQDTGMVTVTGKFDNTVQTYQNLTLLKFADQWVSFDINGIDGKIYRLYQGALNRKPDPAGLGYWLNVAASHPEISMDAIANSFLSSDEFKALYGATPPASIYVSALYSNVLHRAPEKSGYDYWLDVVNRGADRSAVLVAFAESDENKNAVNPGLVNGFDYTPYVVSKDMAPISDQKCTDDGYLGYDTVGQYAVINNMWNAQAVTNSTQCIAYTTYGLVGVKTAEFNWSYNTSVFDVHAYPEILYGHRQGAKRSTTTSLPRQIYNIASAKVTANAKTNCAINSDCRFDTAFDLWFQSENTPTNFKPSLELMVVTDTNWMNNKNMYPDPIVATVRIGDVVYDVHHRIINMAGVGTWEYAAYVAQKNTQTINIEMVDFIKDAQSRGYIRPESYLTTIEFGTEVVYGAGSTVISNYSINVK